MATNALDARLSDGIASLGLALNAAQQSQLLNYIALIEKWNRVYNLTAVREPARMLGLHVFDSLAVCPQLTQSARILDVGSGAGLPGIVLAIANPALQVTMLDSQQKKTTFVQQAIAELKLSNAAVICTRVEAYRPTEKFDLVISRAFAELADFVAGTAHLVSAQGTLLAMKGVYPHDEIARLPADFNVTRVVALTVPEVDGQRHLVAIQKGSS